MAVDSYVMYQSFYEAMKTLDNENQLALFHAMSEYVYYEKEPCLQGTAVGMWALIKPLLDSNIDKRAKKQMAGSIGGKVSGEVRKAKAKQKQSKSEANWKQTGSKREANVNVNGNVNVNVNGNGFKPPTLEEVKEYVRERNSPVDAETFFEYFSKGNWIDSKGNKVRNWKQKLITWEKYQTPEKKTKQQIQNDFIESDLANDLDEIERLAAERIMRA